MADEKMNSPVPQPAIAANEPDCWAGADGNMYTYGKAKKRACVLCRSNFDWDGTPYKTHCSDCYAKKVRKCEVCKVNNLKIDAKPYEKACTSCWLAVRAQSHKPCPSCPPHLATHLRCPMNKPCCARCEASIVSASAPVNQ